MFRLKINTGNAAFSSNDADGKGPEIAHILREVAGRIDAEHFGRGNGQLRDINGNVVGEWSLT